MFARKSGPGTGYILPFLGCLLFSGWVQCSANGSNLASFDESTMAPLTIYGHVAVLATVLSLTVGIPNCVNYASSTTCDILHQHKPEWVEYCCYNMNTPQCCHLGARPCLESCPYNNYNDPWCCSKYNLCCPKKPTTKNPKVIG